MPNTVNLQHVPKLLVYLQNVFLHHMKRERLIWSSGDSRNEGQVSFSNILDIRHSRNQSLPSNSQRHEHGKEILTPIQWATDVYWADARWTLHMVCINYDTMMWYLLELLIPNIIIHICHIQGKILWWKTNNICTFLHRSHSKTFLQVRTIVRFLITCFLVNFGCLQLVRTYLLKPWPNHKAMF